MGEFYYSEKVEGEPSEVWKIYSNVEGWKEWDHDIKQSSLNEPSKGLSNGVKGKIETRFGMNAEFTVIQAENNSDVASYSYVVETMFLKAVFSFEARKLSSSQEVGNTNQSENKMMQIKHGAVYSGFMGGIVSWATDKLTQQALVDAITIIKNRINQPI